MRFKKHHKTPSVSVKRRRMRKAKHVHLDGKKEPMRGIKVRIYLNDEQKILASKILGCSRLVYNLCLAYNNYWYGKLKEAEQKNEENTGSVSESEIERYKSNSSLSLLSDVLEAYKELPEYSFLKEVNQKVLQSSVRHLKDAFDKFFNKELKAGHPQFKKKSNTNSCEFNSQAFMGISGNRVSLIKGLENILFDCSSEDMSYLNRNQKYIQHTTLTKTKSGKYELSFSIGDFREKRIRPVSRVYIPECVEQIVSEIPEVNEKFTYVTSEKKDVGDFLLITDKKTGEQKILRAVGIDPGIKTKASLSDGTEYQNPKVYANMHRREAMLQRRLSKKEKKSDTYDGIKTYDIPKNSEHAGRNKEKARLKLAKYSEKMNNVRENDTHRMTSDIVSKNDIIFIEDTNVAGMLRNHKIARALQDVGLGEVRRQITYKCMFYGKLVRKVGRFYPSSKTCNFCGEKNDELTLSERIWICPNCGKVVYRDFNASRNMLEEGIRLYREELGEQFTVTHISVTMSPATDTQDQ